MPAFLALFAADFLHHFVSQSDDGSHGARSSFTSLLHGDGTGGHQFQTVFKAQAACCGQSRELTQRVACCHFRVEVLSQAQSADHAVQENGRLSDLRLLQFLVSAVEHDFGDVESQNLIGQIKVLFCNGMLLVQGFAHTYKL